MAEPLLRLDDVLKPSYSVFRELLAPQLQAPLGAGAIQRRRQWARPLTRFRLRAPQEDFATGTALWAFFTYVQGDIPFRFNGLQYGDFSLNPLFIGFGDGTQTDFLLPNRNVSAVLVYEGTRSTLGTVVPIVAVNSAAGSVELNNPPAVNAYVRASYRCWYKCVRDYEGNTALTEEWYYSQQSRFEEIALLEVPF